MGSRPDGLTDGDAFEDSGKVKENAIGVYNLGWERAGEGVVLRTSTRRPTSVVALLPLDHGATPAHDIVSSVMKRLTVKATIDAQTVAQQQADADLLVSPRKPKVPCAAAKAEDQGRRDLHCSGAGGTRAQIRWGVGQNHCRQVDGCASACLPTCYKSEVRETVRQCGLVIVIAVVARWQDDQPTQRLGV